MPLPEEVTTTRMYSIDANVPQVKKWREKLDKHGVDYSDFQYITNGLSGADVTLLSLDTGRIHRIGFFFPLLTAQKATALIGPFQKAGKTPKSGENWFLITKNNVRIIGVLRGSHPVFQSKTKEANGLQFGSSTSTGVSETHYPSFIDIGVHRLDWYVLHHNLNPSIAQAMLTGHLAKGMTEVEATAVLGKPDEVTTDDQGARRLYWNVIQRVVGEGRSQVRVWANIADDRVQSFEDQRREIDEGP